MSKDKEAILRLQIDSLRQEGNRLFKSNKLDEAIAVYEQALTLCPALPDNEASPLDKSRALLLTNIAACKLKQGKFKEVTTLCTRALSIDPSNTKALYRRAMAHKKLGILKQALSDLIEAAKIDPNDEKLKREIEELRNAPEIVSGFGIVLPQIPTVTPKPELDPMVVLGDAKPFYITGQIPRVPYKQWKETIEYMKLDMPVILENCPLVQPAVERWTLPYLAQHMGDTANFEVHISPTKDYLYYDEVKNTAKYGFHNLFSKYPSEVHSHNDASYEFKPTITRTNMKFAEFYEAFIKSVSVPDEEKKEYLYLQQVLNEGVGPQIVEDYKQFDWLWLTQIQQALNFGQLRFNTLWISEKGLITKNHYDEAHNLFAQVSGRKLFYLFHPDQYPCMYCYPLHHHHDRQSQVDIDNPDFEKFPRFREAKGIAGIVGPGDVLYLPPYWFHYVKSLDQSVSLNFWFRILPANTQELTLPLNGIQLMAVRRNIERMIGEAVGPSQVGTFLTELTAGRFQYVK